MIRTIYSILIYFILVVSLSIGLMICFIFSLFSRSKTKIFMTGARVWGKLMVLISGIQFEVSGAENIPRGKGVIFAANHQSSLDSIMTLAGIPVNFIVLIAKEYFRLPLFGWGWKKAGYIPIDRKNLMSFNLAVKKMVNIIKAGGSVLIFPESTRSRSGKLAEFKNASLLPALLSGAPVIPLAISGSYDILPPKSWVLNPGKVKFSFGEPIHITSDAEYNQKIKEVHDSIAKML